MTFLHKAINKKQKQRLRSRNDKDEQYDPERRKNVPQEQKEMFDYLHISPFRFQSFLF